MSRNKINRRSPQSNIQKKSEIVRKFVTDIVELESEPLLFEEVFDEII